MGIEGSDGKISIAQMRDLARSDICNRGASSVGAERDARWSNATGRA
jgi:hypothetical protein